MFIADGMHDLMSDIFFMRRKIFEIDEMSVSARLSA